MDAILMEEQIVVDRAEIRSNDGIARIRSEFLVTDYVREVDLDFLSAKDREKLNGNDVHVENGNGSSGDTPVDPKIKLKGTNKSRNKGHAVRDLLKLCSFVVRAQTCPYGDKCRFSHKEEDYLQTRLPDISEACPFYSRKGHCPFGITCRFSSGHLNSSEIDGEKRPIVIDIADGYTNEDEMNGITKELQRKLRKRSYHFAQSEDNGNGVDEPMPELDQLLRPTGAVVDEEQIRLRPSEKRSVDFRGKLYLAPLTTVGNLPFRRVCKSLGADITCGEMALAANLLAGQQSEWALLARHKSEDLFGVQVCGGKPDVMEKLAHILKSEVNVDFVDINCGCPIDLVCNGGGGCSLMGRYGRLESVVKNMKRILDVPLTVKMRVGLEDNKNFAHELIPKLRGLGVDMVTVHGRTRQQRYTRLADWDYVAKCATAASPMPLFGNGDCMSYLDYYEHMETAGVSGVLIARGALIKPWIFTEIKEGRHWDISGQERLHIFKDFANFGLDHWGSDTRGVENVRRFLLEWMSFTYRYIPVGLLELLPQRINDRPPRYRGRTELETLLSSPHCRDWIKVTEMFLGPAPDGFTFLPKHKANAWK